jgi:hypothetical protein
MKKGWKCFGFYSYSTKLNAVLAICLWRFEFQIEYRRKEAD